MTDAIEITAEAVRQNLLRRAAAYCEGRKASFSSISDAAVSDSKFLARVQNGENFTLKTYQKVIDWIDQAERGEAA